MTNSVCNKCGTASRRKGDAGQDTHSSISGPMADRKEWLLYSVLQVGCQLQIKSSLDGYNNNRVIG